MFNEVIHNVDTAGNRVILDSRILSLFSAPINHLGINLMQLKFSSCGLREFLPKLTKQPNGETFVGMSVEYLQDWL